MENKRIFKTLCESPYNIREKKQNISDMTEYDLAKTRKMFRYENLPDTIPQRFLERYLQCNGYCAIAKHNDKLYAYQGGLGGELDVYYFPTIFTVSNPYQNFNKNLKVNEDCVIIGNDSSYMGLLPLLIKHNTLLAECDISVLLAEINLRAISLISATTESSRLAGEKFIKDIEDGKLSVIGDEAFLEGVKTQPYATGQNNTITQLMELQQFLKGSKYNDLGLNSAYNLKRSYVGKEETKLNDDVLLPLVDDMLECRKEGIAKVNDLFGTNIEVYLDSAWSDRHEFDEHTEEVENSSVEDVADSTDPIIEDEEVEDDES